MEELLKAIKYLHFAKEQGTITSYNIFNEEEIEFKFKVNGYEETDSCEIEEYKTIGGRIKEAIEQYWEGAEEEERYREQCEADYISVCCG